MKIKNCNKIIISFLIYTFFSSHLLYASEIIIEDNFSEANNNDVVSSFNESFVSGDTAQIDNEPDTIDSQVVIEEDITPDEEIQEDTPEEINEEDISTITEDLPIFDTFSLRNTTTYAESFINSNILEKDTVTKEDFESLRIDPYSIKAGDDILYYFTTNIIEYRKIISLNPLITYQYFTIDLKTKKLTISNFYNYYDSTYYYFFIKKSDERIIISKINNSDNVSIENANLSVDNKTLESKVDRIENCIYLVIFSVACCFGGICAKGFFDKL